MNSLLKIEKIMTRLNKAMGYIAGIAVFWMMFAITADVLLRNMLNSPITGTYESVQYIFMPIVVFPALAYTYQSDILPRFDGFDKSRNQTLRTISFFVTVVAEFVIFGLLTYYSIQFAMSGWADKMAVPSGGKLLPTYPVYILVAMGFILLFIQCLLKRIKQFKESK